MCCPLNVNPSDTISNALGAVLAVVCRTASFTYSQQLAHKVEVLQYVPYKFRESIRGNLVVLCGGWDSLLSTPKLFKDRPTWPHCPH